MEPTKNQTEEIGYAATINDYIVWISGLPNIQINELVISSQKAQGLVTTIKDGLVEVLILNDVKIKPKEEFRRTFKQLSINAGNHLIGRTINPMGQPIDGKGPLAKSGSLIELEKAPAPIKDRAMITRQFETGVTIVDNLVPIAFGQRELIIGDAHSGKTGFLLDTVINQKGKNVICVYAMIGKPLNEIFNLVEILKVNKTFDYTIAIAASSSERAPLGFLAPIVAVSIAEFFQQKGLDVLLIMDDLGIHAKIYREISLLSGRAPGRQSFPGDIFYQHAKLVERAGNFNKNIGGGSITALPVIEVSEDDFASFLSTNLMGMTDGHLKFDSTRYHQGHRPSIDVGLSVSRVGRQTQMLSQKSLSDKVKTVLAEGKKLEAYSRLGSDVSAETQLKLKQSRQIEVILNQASSTKIPILIQMILLGLTFTPFLAQKDVNFVYKYKTNIIEYLGKTLNLEELQKQVARMKDEKVFIESITKLIPDLEKICRP